MIRNRAPRFRNLQNLHVIPTASNINLNTKPAPSKSELSPLSVLPVVSNKNIEEKMFDQNKSKNRFNKRRKSKNKRKRQVKSFAASQTMMPNSSYHWYNPGYLDQAVCSLPPSEKIEEVESTSEIPVEEDFEEVEVASVEADGKQEILVGFRTSKLKYLNYTKKFFFKPKIYKFGSQRTLVNCLNVQDNCSVDVDVVSEAEYEIENETDNLDQSESQNQQMKIAKTNMENVKGNHDSTRKLEETPLKEENQKFENKDAEGSSERTFKTSLDDNADVKQGQCLIQSSLDTRKSHLIGLEYLIEIRNKSEAKYCCVLCSEDLLGEEFPAVNVINHINGCKHIVRYLEKHFPSYGFKFDENSDNVALQKICEEIHEKFGFSSMFVTNLDYYEKNELKIKNIVQNASHVSENSLKLENYTFQMMAESDTLKEVRDVVDGIIKKILAPEENTVISAFELTENVPIKLEKEGNSKVSSELPKGSLNKADKICVHNESISKNKLQPSKSFIKCRGNSAISSYLKLKYARAKFKGLKSFKGISSTIQGPSTENIDSRKKKVIDGETSKVQPTQSGEKVSDIVNSNANKRILGNEEKIVQKPTVHSKHCRKRILGRETTRLKVDAKASTKDEFFSGVLNKPKVKYVSVSGSGNHNSSKRIAYDKSVKHSEIMVISSHKSSPVRKVTSVPIQKVSKDSKSPFTRYSKSPHRRIVLKRGIEGFKHKTDVMRMSPNSSSHWKAMTRASSSSVKSPIECSPHMLKNETRKRSPLQKNTVRRTVRRQSKSPLRLVIRSPVRKYSRSPAKRHSRSPAKRHSRSPVKRHSRSPVKRNPSPYQNLSKSPLRKKSRSPYWRHSRSPVRRKSRSPIRRRSRSSLRRYSRSPFRRCSKSPLRRYSRSPLRRHSRSPLRRYSRSPVRRRSRSPMRRCSRSPVRRCSRSPARRRSRSPWKRNSRNPVKRHSRSPVRRQSRSPIKRHRSPISEHSRNSVGLSRSPAREFRSIYKVMSPNIGHSGRDQDRLISKERYSHNLHNYDEHLDLRDREYSKAKSSKSLHTFVSNTSDKHKSQIFSSGAVKGISDLDPVSDEDESVYFDKTQHVEDSMTSSSKMMLTQLFQKFSIPNVNPDDPSLNKLKLFMEAHRAEIQELLGSQSVSKAGKISSSKVDSSVQERSLFLQQYLLSNLAGSSQEQGLPSVSVNMQPKYQQPPFLSENVRAGYGHVPDVAPHGLPQPNAPRFFPPNINVPPPEPYRPFSQNFSPQSQVPPEVMFKDLKATVNKLFGANEGATKQEKNKPVVPGYVTVPDPEKWDLNHPDTQKFNASTGPQFSGHINPRFNAPVGQKNAFHPQGKPMNFGGTPENSVIRADMPLMYNNNNNAPGQFFGGGRGIDRSQGQNVTIPPPDAKVSFCDVPRGSAKGNLFPVVHNVNSNFNSPNLHGGVSDVKVSLAQRLASVLVKVGMTDVPAPLLQEMLMKIGAFSSLPRQDISEAEIISILKRLGYLS